MSKVRPHWESCPPEVHEACRPRDLQHFCHDDKDDVQISMPRPASHHVKSSVGRLAARDIDRQNGCGEKFAIRHHKKPYCNPRVVIFFRDRLNFLLCLKSCLPNENMWKTLPCPIFYSFGCTYPLALGGFHATIFMKWSRPMAPSVTIWLHVADEVIVLATTASIGVQPCTSLLDGQYESINMKATACHHTFSNLSDVPKSRGVQLVSATQVR